MRIKDVLKQKKEKVVYRINTNKTLCNAAKIFTEHRIGSLIVENDDGTIAGIITEKDILKICRDRKGDVSQQLVKNAMTPFEELITVSENDPINKAMEIMTDNRIKHLPVFKENKLVGLVSIGDLVKSMLEKSRKETKRLQDYISGDYPEE